MNPFHWTSYKSQGDTGIRGDLRYGEWEQGQRTIHVEATHWSRWSHGLGAAIIIGGEDRTLAVRLMFWRLFLHIGIRNAFSRAMASASYEWSKRTEPRAKRLTGTWAHDLDPFNHSREFGASINSERVRVDFWRNAMGGWSSNKPVTWPWLSSGWEWSFGWFDALFGRSQHHYTPGEWHDGSAEIGGVTYPLRIHTYRARWARRWPWSGTWFHRYDVSIAGHDHNDPKVQEGGKAPMFAGKGENSWDCDDNCIYMTGGPIRREAWTVAEAVAAYVASYDQSVKRYGRASA